MLTENGGARRDRTDDLLLAKQALSQLSYGPMNAAANGGGSIRSHGDAATAASYLRMAAGGQPLFSDRVAPAGPEKNSGRRDHTPATRRRYLAGLSGRRVSHGVKNRLIGHLAATDI
jgi:hypothetical protein